MSTPGASLCTFGDVKSLTWVLVTARVVAVVVLAPGSASAESPKAKGLLQVDPGKERVKFSVGIKS